MKKLILRIRCFIFGHLFIIERKQERALPGYVEDYIDYFVSRCVHCSKETRI